jgi:tRNA nucleotidyltransferase/poly(A) polymerase
VRKPVEDYVAALGLDAYVVGGAVRDELLGLESKDADFLVPGIDADGLRAVLTPCGRVEDLIVAGQPVGLRLYPRDREIRALAPAGIEFAPSRRERSTGPGRHDFDIVVDPSASIEDDLARRDFTVNAIARRLEDGTIVDPYEGRADLEHRVLRTVSTQSFAEDPLRLVRCLRFAAQLDFDPDEETLRQMKAEAPAVRLVSAERIGGGVASDGMGELSKLLLGRSPRKALRLAQDTGVLAYVLPELEESDHVFDLVQSAADAGRPLRLRLAALFRELDETRAAAVLRRLRYPNRLRAQVAAIVRNQPIEPGDGTPLAARKLLARHGEELTLDLLALREDERGAVDGFRAVVEAELSAPYRLGDLAVDGSDLIALGYRPGPALGRALADLLEEVVADPARNTRETLLARAEELRVA